MYRRRRDQAPIRAPVEVTPEAPPERRNLAAYLLLGCLAVAMFSGSINLQTILWAGPLVGIVAVFNAGLGFRWNFRPQFYAGLLVSSLVVLCYVLIVWSGWTIPDRELNRRAMRMLVLCATPIFAFVGIVLGVMPPEEQLEKRPLRFTISTLVGLTVVAAIALFLSRLGAKGTSAGVALLYVACVAYFVVRMERAA